MKVEVPDGVKGFPVLPVAVAFAAGFSIAMVVSMVMEARTKNVGMTPCPDCAEKAKRSEREGRAVAEALGIPIVDGYSAHVYAPDVKVEKVYDQTKAEVVEVVVPVEPEPVDAPD